jgi:hypothetical protein
MMVEQKKVTHRTGRSDASIALSVGVKIATYSAGASPDVNDKGEKTIAATVSDMQSGA